MLELKNICITLTQTGRKLFDNFNFTLNAGEKAVVIGEEGNGKSTLIQMIYDPALIEGYCEYSGQIIKKGALAYLPQLFPVEFIDFTVGEYAGEAREQSPEVWTRLGLDYEALAGQSIATLSGGEKIKIQLAKILMTQPDILLLDEPTNDIDIETLSWLEDFIESSKQAVLFISHDETLIERCANTIIHIEQLVRKTKPKVSVARYSDFLPKGKEESPYRQYVRSRSLAFGKQMQVAKKQRSDHKSQMDRWRQIYSRVDHEQRRISRQDPAGARLLKKKMKSVKSTGKRLEREAEDFIDIPQMEEAILTKFDAGIALPTGKVVLDMQLPLLQTNRILARDINLKVMGGEKVGIYGKNGAGKTTLLREIWDILRDRKDITASYMPQDYREVLDHDLSAIEFLAEDAKKESIQQVRTFLGSMKFTHEEMTEPINALSGGQRAKVLFLDMVLKKADVLVLDEPTRNFSPLSGPVIRETLKEFGGTIISVSHDRKYLDEVCNRVYLLDAGGLALRLPY